MNLNFAISLFLCYACWYAHMVLDGKTLFAVPLKINFQCTYEPLNRIAII